MRIFFFMLLSVNCCYGDFFKDIVKHPLVGNSLLGIAVYSDITQAMAEFQEVLPFVTMSRLLCRWSLIPMIALSCVYLPGIDEDRYILKNKERSSEKINFLRREIAIASSSFITLYAGYTLYKLRGDISWKNKENVAFLLLTIVLGASRVWENASSHFVKI